MRARLIRTDGSTESWELPQDEGEAFYHIGETLGTYAPAPSLLVRQEDGRPGLVFWHNAGGLLSEQPENATAGLVAFDLLGYVLPEWIAGDVVATGALDSSGCISGLTEGQDKVLAELAARWQLAEA